MQFNLLPEWHPQKCILLTWPHPQSDWADSLHEITTTYITLTKNLSMTAKVMILAFNQQHLGSIQTELARASTNLNNIEIIIVPTNDTWIRDYGPLSCLNNKELCLLDFQFNGYGNKYPHELDNNVTPELLRTVLSFKNKEFNFILEGGSIETNGAGTLLTTTNCLLNPNRNNLSETETSLFLKDTFNCNNIVWLANCMLMGDDTDSHIDNFARFISPDTICYLTCNDKNDFHYKSLQLFEQEMKYKLSKFNLIPLPLPSAIMYKGERLPASYLNFLITNNSVIVPTFHDELDSSILGILQDLNSSKDIIPIDSRMLISQGGGIHCSTMQIANN